MLEYINALFFKKPWEPIPNQPPVNHSDITPALDFTLNDAIGCIIFGAGLFSIAFALEYFERHCLRPQNQQSSTQGVYSTTDPELELILTRPQTSYGSV